MHRISLQRHACRAVVLGFLLSQLAPGVAAQPPKPITHTVTMDGTQFKPATLTVKPGDTIEWVNKDLIPHTATAKAGGFDSGSIAPGKSWKYTVRKGGNIDYICTFHPTMKGKLMVKSLGGQAPTRGPVLGLHLLAPAQGAAPVGEGSTAQRAAVDEPDDGCSVRARIDDGM